MKLWMSAVRKSFCYKMCNVSLGLINAFDNCNWKQENNVRHDEGCVCDAWNVITVGKWTYIL